MKALYAKYRNWMAATFPSPVDIFIIKIALFFLIALVYNLLRPIKITLVVSSEGSGPEIIPFLKVWGILPSAIAFTAFFTFLINRFEKETVFKIITMTFLGFFVLFGCVLFPFREFFVWNQITDILSPIIPSGFNGFISMLKHWHLSLFYIFSELWGTIILNLLFWGFINEVTPLDEAKQSYGYFVFGANIATILAGEMGANISQNPLDFIDMSWTQSYTRWELAVGLYMFLVTIFGALILLLFQMLTKRISSHLKSAAMPVKLSKLNLRESFKTIYHSKHLFYLTIIVLGYNIAYNLIDVILTNQLHEKFKDDITGFNSFISRITVFNGILAATFALFFTTPILKRFGWLPAALLTPFIVLVTSIILIPSFFNINFGMSVTAFAGVTLFLCAVQNILTRSAKYTFFDATKELSFIPLPPKEQRLGKAAIDGICSRFGKSGGSLIYQTLLVFFTTISATLPIVSVILFGVLFCWIYAVFGLNKELKKELVGENGV